MIGLYINTEPLAILPGSTFTWALTYGLDPNYTELTTTKLSAERIAKMAEFQFPPKNRTRTRRDSGPLTLTIEDSTNKRKVEVKGLYAVVSNRPGNDYNTRTITLVDRRWLFEHTLVVRSYNIRRKTGDFRLIAGQLYPVQLANRRADVAYRRMSLNKGRPWTAVEVLKDVLQEITGDAGFVIDGNLKFTDSIEGLELADKGPEALRRVLSYIPGAQIYVGYDGKVHVAQLYDQSELGVFRKFGAPNSGDWSVVDRSAQRPKFYRVFSDREVELRFDVIEEKDATDTVSGTSPQGTGSVVRPQDEDIDEGKDNPPPLWAENVIINPLYYLPLDVTGTRVATQGEPVPLDQFIDGVNLLTKLSNSPAPQFPFGTRGFRPKFPNFVLDKREIRRHWLGNWSAFRDKFCLAEDGIFNPERLLLLSAIRSHYRQTFRVLPQWQNRIRTLEAARTAILDYETGTRGPAPVFAQYITKFSQIGYNPLSRGKLATINNDFDENVGQANVSPFEVSILNSDIGLFRVSPKPDQTGTAESYVLGAPEGDKLPSVDAKNIAVFWNTVYLDRGFKLAVILSATQDSPNSEKRMHEEEVSVEDAAKLLGVTTLNACRSPDYELVQTAESARYAWDDRKADEIRRAFFGGAPYPLDTMTNRSQIRAASLATAASHLAQHIDRVEGRITGPMRPVSPTGNLRAVVHTVSVNATGAASLFTTIVAPGNAPEQQIYSLMPEGIRRKLRRLVQE